MFTVPTMRITAAAAIAGHSMFVAAWPVFAQVSLRAPSGHHLTQTPPQVVTHAEARARQGRKAGVERDSVQLRNASSDDIANARQTLCNDLTRSGRARASCASDERFMVDSCRCTGYPRTDRNYYQLGCTVRWRCALRADGRAPTVLCTSPSRSISKARWHLAGEGASKERGGSK